MAAPQFRQAISISSSAMTALRARTARRTWKSRSTSVPASTFLPSRMMATRPDAMATSTSLNSGAPSARFAGPVACDAPGNSRTTLPLGNVSFRGSFGGSFTAFTSTLRAALLVALGLDV